MKTILTLENFKWIAEELKCEPEVIQSINKVEAPRSAFDSDGFPSILFERHVFYRNAPKDKRDQWQKQHPTLCNKSVTPSGGYGSFASQRVKFSRAFLEMDKRAAMMACSWGAFQVLGENYKGLGFSTVDEFVDMMKAGIGGQAEIFIRFIKSNYLVTALRNKDWPKIARVYNGPSYAKHGYDKSLAREYAAFKKRGVVWSGVDSVKPEIEGTKVTVEESAIETFEEIEILKEQSKELEVLQEKMDEVQENISEPEKIAIAKPKPMGFWKGLWTRITAALGTNIGMESVSTYAQQFGALGLPPSFWKYISVLVLITTVLLLAGYIYNRRGERRREEMITKMLIEANNVEGNTVQLVDQDLLEFYRSQGYKIITR